MRYSSVLLLSPVESAVGRREQKVAVLGKEEGGQEGVFLTSLEGMWEQTVAVLGKVEGKEEGV